MTTEEITKLSALKNKIQLKSPKEISNFANFFQTKKINSFTLYTVNSFSTFFEH